MKRNRIFCAFGTFFVLVSLFCFPASGAGASFSESATVQAYYSLVAFQRLCEGKPPLYLLDNEKAATNGEKITIKAAGRAKTLADGIVALKMKECGASTAQEWIEKGLAKKAGKTAEWYVLGLSQSGRYDFSAYETALLQFLKDNPVTVLTTGQKYALALIAAGSRDPFIENTAAEDLEQAGIMAKIFGLHLLNNGLSGKNRPEEVVRWLLDMRLEDGGWALTGKNADVDVTAMTLQALAPHCGDPAVKAAVEKAVNLLAGRQSEAGDFASMGVYNAESTAQVLTALSSLGIDCERDARFIKNGNTVIDGLIRYRLVDGSFTHMLAPSQDPPAQSEAPSSSEAPKVPGNAASVPSESGKDASAPAGQAPDDTASADSEVPAESQKEEQVEEDASVVDGRPDAEKKQRPVFPLYKGIACGCILLFVLAGAGLLALRKKANRKNILLLGLIGAALLLFVVLTDFESVTAHRQVDQKTDVIGTVTVSIRCDTVAGKTDSDFIPRDGCILSSEQVEIESGDTVYTVLDTIARKKGIQIEKKGSDGMIYIAAIGYLYEFQFGEMSGWVYHVNGESPFVGCDSYEVKPGDRIEWMYTLDLGLDVGNTFSVPEEGGS